MPDAFRRRAGVALVVATALLLAAAGVAGYARLEIADSDAFAARSAAALDDDAFRAVVAGQLVDAVSRTIAPDALAVRPLAVAAAAALLDSGPFRNAFESAVRSRHRALVAGERRWVFSLIPDDRLAGRLARGVATSSLEFLPHSIRLPVLTLDPRDFELELARKLTGLARWWWPLLAAALLAAAACALLAGSLRDAIARVAFAVACAGALVAGATAALGALVVAHAAHATGLIDTAERAGFAALWSALLGDLRTAGLVAAIGGVAVATLAAGAPALERLQTRARELARTARAPGPRARRARAAALVAAGALLLLWPGTVLRAAAAVAGAGLLLTGAALLAGSPPARAQDRSRGAPGLVLAGVVAAVAVATIVVVALVVPAPRAAPFTVASAPDACNGLAALCDRRLDEVVMPATHNSYAAAAEPGWIFPNQRFGIARQLRDGIRGFLLDIHYGVPDAASGRIRTDLAYEGSSRNKVRRELGPAALRTADRVAGHVGVAPVEGDRAPYLCHTLCELGAEPLDEQLAIFRRFLDANPREVVVMFIEPYVPVEETERALERTGLLRYAAHLRLGEPLPTLGELIASGRRLVVLSEYGGGARPWYLDGFAFVQDTPYTAARPSEFSCRRNRGSADSPLFLVNHWITTFPPSPTRNQRAGGNVLAQRLRRCEQERGLVPNLVAVDFYERSRVTAIAARMNRAR